MGQIKRKLPESEGSVVRPLGLDNISTGVLLYAYAVLLGIAYLFSFWRPIGFDIFPYLSLQDYVSAPLNRALVLIALPIVVPLILYGRSQSLGSNRSQAICLAVFFGYCAVFIAQAVEATSRFFAFDFAFRNEATVIVIFWSLFICSCVVALYVWRSESSLLTQVSAIVLIQIAASLAAGYSDGKSIYNGADRVHFLDNKEVCEKGGVRDWVYLGRFSGGTLFLNTIDKRICITQEKELKLASRVRREGLPQ